MHDRVERRARLHLADDRAGVTVAMLQARPAVVDARKLGRQIVERLALVAVGIRRQVERPAFEMRRRVGEIARRARPVGVREQRHARIDHDVEHHASRLR